MFCTQQACESAGGQLRYPHVWRSVQMWAICFSVYVSSESLCFLLAEGSWRRTDVLDATFTDIQVGRVKIKAAQHSVSPEHTTTFDAAYTPANTVWHLIHHQSLQVNVS